MEYDERCLLGLVLAMVLLATGQGCGSASMDGDLALDPENPVADGPPIPGDPEPGVDREPDPDEALPPVTDLEPELVLLTRGDNNSGHHIWGTSETDVFLAGPRGLLAHFDGARWRPFEPGYPYSQRDFTWVFGFSSRDVYAGNDEGGVLHFDGETWTEFRELDGFLPTAFWGSSPDNLYAVSGAEIAHFDGQQWQRLDTDLRSDVEWKAISGSGEKHVVLLGREDGNPGSLFAHFDGVGWKEHQVPTSALLYDIWSANPAETFAVGFNGTILHFDGKSIDAMGTDTNSRLQSVRGGSAKEVYACGGGGVVLQYDGNVWTRTAQPPIPDPTSSLPCKSILSLGQGRLLAAGQGVHHYDGESWETLISYMGDINDIWARSPDDVLFVGSSTHRFDGFVVAPENIGAFEYVELVAAWGAGERTYALGNDDGVEIYLHDGEDWGLMASNSSSGSLLDIHGTAEDDVFAVGYEGQILHHDGSGWSSMDSQTQEGLSSVWAASPDDVYVVGFSGEVLHYDGDEWSPILSGSSSVFPHHVTGFDSEHIVAPGLSGEVYFGDGVSWKPEQVDLGGVSNEIVRVHGTSPNDMYAVGSGGLSHYDGESWTHIDPLAPGGSSQRVFAVSPREVYVSGVRGAFRFTIP